MRPTTVRSARTWRWARVRPKVGQFNGPGNLVWAAPPLCPDMIFGRQSGVAADRIACDHVSGLLVRSRIVESKLRYPDLTALGASSAARTGRAIFAITSSEHGRGIRSLGMQAFRQRQRQQEGGVGGAIGRAGARAPS